MVNDIIGYAGMALLVSSFLMRNMVLLRLLNLLGGILSAIYGFLTKTYPTAILNVILVSINLAALTVFFIKKYKIVKGTKEEGNKKNIKNI